MIGCWSGGARQRCVRARERERRTQVGSLSGEWARFWPLQSRVRTRKVRRARRSCHSIRHPLQLTRPRGSNRSHRSTSSVERAIIYVPLSLDTTSLCCVLVTFSSIFLRFSYLLLIHGRKDLPYEFAYARLIIPSCKTSVTSGQDYTYRILCPRYAKK